MSYAPCWEDVHFAAKDVAIKNEWRTTFLSIGWEDLFQEGWMVFKKCIDECNEYQNRWHFLAFFKRAFKNKITDMIKYKRTEKENEIDIIEYDNESSEISLIDTFISKESADFKTKLKEAPEYISNVITLLKVFPNMNRITNRRLCAMLGYDSNKIDLIKEVKNYFKG